MERIFDVEQQYPDTEFKKYIHVSKLGIDSRLYNSYEACPDTIRLIVNSLEVYPTDSVVDIGCGKGYAMYAMAQKPFSQIDGIEICPHLAETALHNLSAIFGKGDRRFHIYTEDAALFDKWDDYTYAFMYNPFKEICMGMVIEHIRASIIKANGAAPKKDLIELWKRIVFNMAVSNTDDHMRNHGFILKADGWHLSPLYDVNPVPEGDELSLCVNEDDATISLDLALEIAPYCEISTKDAAAMAADVLKTVRENWNRLATECGLSRSAQEYMRPAFSLALE